MANFTHTQYDCVRSGILGRFGTPCGKVQKCKKKDLKFVLGVILNHFDNVHNFPSKVLESINYRLIIHKMQEKQDMRQKHVL